MNGFYNEYDRVVIETPEERRQKAKKQRKLFSRVFISLVIYIVVSRVAAIGTYALMKSVLSAERYHAFANSTTWSVIVSCAAQYAIAFPILLLTLIGTDKAKERKTKKLSGTEFFLLFAMGEALMYAGNFIGTFLNGIIGGITGRMPQNDIATIVNEIPVWLIFVCMVVIAPIVEELIFRKLMIDRLSIYGDRTAILFSSVAFGLMHGNLYQFFYAVLLGALLGYVYTKTRNVSYTIYMHAIVNFMGSIVALPVQKAMLELSEMLEAASKGIPINLASLTVSGTVLLIYVTLEYGLMIGGVIALVQYAKKKKIVISPDKEIYLPDNEVRKNGIANVGAITFLVVSFITIVTNLIFT